MDEEIKDVVLNIRACIQSSKDPVPLGFLERDYDTLAGGEIPYRKFNFNSLESFLRSLDSLEVRGSGHEAAVIARISAQSKHVTDLIRKTPKPKSKKPFQPTLSHYQARGARGAGRGYVPRGGGRGSSDPYRGSYPSRGSYPPRGNNYPRDNSYSSRGLSYAPASKTFSRDHTESWDNTQQYSEPTQSYSNYSESRSGTAQSNFQTQKNNDTRKTSREEMIAGKENIGYDRLPSPEEIVIKVEANDKREVVLDTKSSKSQGGRPNPFRTNSLQGGRPNTYKSKLPPRLQKLKEHRKQGQWDKREFNYVNLLDESAFEEQKQDFPESHDRSIDGVWQHNLFEDYSANTGEDNASSSKQKNHDYKNNEENIQTTRFNRMPKRQSGLAPRFQNLETHDNVIQTPAPEEDLSKNYEETLHIDPTPQSSITCPYGPSELIAAGRLKQQEKDFRGHGEQGGLILSSQPIVDEVLKVPEPDEVVILNNVILLKDYLIKAGFDEPVYSFIKIKDPDRRQIMCMAKVKINQGHKNIKTVSSFPEEHPKEEIAKGYAAKAALKIMYEEEKVKDLQNITAKIDESVLFDRITEVIAGAYNGVFAPSVEQTYVARFNECLPEDWIEILRSCPTISVEQSLSSYIIVPKDPNLSLVPPQSPTPQIMEFPPDDIWNVYVTSIMNSSYVNLLVVGENYSDLYNELSSNMNIFYKTIGSKEITLNIEKGKFYAAEVAEDTWHRVLIWDIDNTQRTVNAWLIDHGDSEEINFSSLYRLPAEFCNLPMQCVPCELEGLEKFADDCSAAEIVAKSEHLIGKTLVANVTDRNIEEGYIRAILFDTSGADDLNVNEALKEAIIYEKAEPDLPHEGHAKEVYVVSISKRGEVFIQIPSPSCQELLDTVAALNDEDIVQHKLTSYRQMNLEKMYLAKYSVDNNWYRAKITSAPSLQHDRITVRFVDFGNEETVSMSDIASVEQLPPIIDRLPYQAVKVVLHDLPLDSFSPSEIAKLKSLLLDEQKVILVKTIKIQEDLPQVEIFYKNEQDDNALVSVNNTLEFQRQKRENQISLLNDNAVLADLKIGTFVPIKIVLAANPSTFWFTLLKFEKELQFLMVQMAYAYENTTPSLSKDDIVKGELYAAQYDDDKWYRVLATGNVIGSFGGLDFSIRLVDFGDMNWVPLSRIRQLEAPYRKLPFLAIKGKLAGVRPVNQDWSVNDCVTFQKLTATKLAAVVKKIEKVEMETVVSLSLFNTNQGEEDINIAQVLIDDKRAIEHL